MAYLRNWHGVDERIFQAKPYPDFDSLSAECYDYVVLLNDMMGRWGTPEDNYGMCGPMHGLFRDPSAALQRLFDDGYLIVAQPTEERMIDARFDVPSLKELCGKYGLKKTGKRQELIQRLLDAGHKQDFLDRPPWHYLSTTEAGRALINALYQQCFLHEAKAFLSLADCDPEKAIEICMEYEKNWRISSSYNMLQNLLSMKKSLNEIKYQLSSVPTFENTIYWYERLFGYPQLDEKNMADYLEQGCPAWFVPIRYKYKKTE